MFKSKTVKYYSPEQTGLVGWACEMEVTYIDYNKAMAHRCTIATGETKKIARKFATKGLKGAIKNAERRAKREAKSLC